MKNVTALSSIQINDRSDLSRCSEAERYPVDGVRPISKPTARSGVERKRRCARVLLTFALGAAAGSSLAAPAVQQVNGSLNHKATISLSGSGFGVKPNAAPLVWDDASGNSILDKWDGAWPNNNATYNTGYRTPQRGISLPHANITRYIAGAHGQNAGANGGYNVTFWKNINVTSLPSNIYASWYQRADDAWVFGGDNNFKTFAYSVCCTPYEMPHNWYTGYGPPLPGSRTDTPGWGINDDGASLRNPDLNGHSFWWNSGVNPMAGQWAKVEIAVRITDQNDGYIKVWENGRIKVDYLGPTDKYAGRSRSVGIGGYARIYGQPNNWRYFADAYFDTTLARVVLANNANLSQASIIENQIPSRWTGTTIDVTVNLGKFTRGQTAYLFVVDAAGARNTQGYPVTIGEAATGGLVVPNSPTGVTVN